MQQSELFATTAAEFMIAFFNLIYLYFKRYLVI